VAFFIVDFKLTILDLRAIAAGSRGQISFAKQSYMLSVQAYLKVREASMSSRPRE